MENLININTMLDQLGLEYTDQTGGRSIPGTTLGYIQKLDGVTHMNMPLNKSIKTIEPRQLLKAIKATAKKLNVTLFK